MILKVQILFKSSGLMMAMKFCASYEHVLIQHRVLKLKYFLGLSQKSGRGTFAIVNISKNIKAIYLFLKTFSLFIL